MTFHKRALELAIVGGLALTLLAEACGGAPSGASAEPPASDGGLDGAQVTQDGGATSCTGLTNCGGECVDSLSDVNHCGSCDKACEKGLSCALGECHSPLGVLWNKTLPGEPLGEAFDSNGNLYITGTLNKTVDLGGGPLPRIGIFDIFVVSYSPTGAHRWSRRFGAGPGDGLSGADDRGAGITVAAGKVYVTGAYQGSVDFGGGPIHSASYHDTFVLTLDAASGVFASARGFGVFGDDRGNRIGVDASGNVTVAGGFVAGSLEIGGIALIGHSSWNGFLVSFDPTGKYRWSRVQEAQNANEVASLAVSSTGNVVAAGSFNGTIDLGTGPLTAVQGAFLASYSTDGVPRFVRQLVATQPQGYSQARPACVAVDPAGNIALGGNFNGAVSFGAGAQLVSAAGYPGFVARFDATGAATFVRQIAVVGPQYRGGVKAVGFDGKGNIVAASNVDGPPDLGMGPIPELGGTDALVVGYDPTGKVRFARRFGGDKFASVEGLVVANGGSMALLGGQNVSDEAAVLLISPP